MRGEHARLWTEGGWGEPNPPAFAYDLTKGELYKRAKLQGLRRYGKAPNSSDDDTRPLGLTYRIEWVISPTGTEMTPEVSSGPLIPLGNAFYDQDAIGLGQTDHAANQAVGYKGLNVPKNGAWSLWCYLHTPPKGQITKLMQWFCGKPGEGYVFQIRSGTAEIAGLSAQYNETDMNVLRVLWGIKNPTQAEQDQIDTLKTKLFEDFESLSFENNTGKGDWYGNEFEVTFIPESRGALHIVLEGLDATVHEFKRITKTRQEGTINAAGPIRLWNAGGAFFFCLGFPRFVEKATLTLGPLKAGNYFADHLGDLAYNYNASLGDGQTLTIEKIDWDNVPEMGVRFGFLVTITNPNPSASAWVHGIAARLAPGNRNPIEEARGFDTDVYYLPANPVAQQAPAVILDIEPQWEGALNRRSARVSIMNPLGRMSYGKPSPENRVANLQMADGQMLFTQGIVCPGVQKTDALSLKTEKSESPKADIVLTVADGWQILDTTECEPPPIGDGMLFGAYVKALLSLGGFADRVSGIPNAGRRITRAALGEDWAERADAETMIGDVLRTAFDCYGLGWELIHDVDGEWRMYQPSNLATGVFSSSRAITLFSEPGRLTILRDIDRADDTTDFWNHIIIRGGEKGEITSEWTDWKSVRDPTAPNFIGRRKTKRITSTGLRTQDDVNYAARSARYRYGQWGERAEFESLFHRRFVPNQRIEADGGLWRITGLPSSSWAKDVSRYAVMRVSGAAL